MGWLRDSRLRLALEISVLLHLLLAWVAPLGRPVLAALLPAPEAPVVEVARDDDPIRFELVELPDQREETPSRADAPGSDLSRRAHGGEGAPAESPGVQGNTPDLRVALASPPEPQRPASEVPPIATDAESLSSDPPAPVADGAAAVLAPRVPPSPAAQPAIKGLSEATRGGGGAGALPDRRGGQVDLGPLSFDTEWFDWGPYAAEMLRRIRYHWRIPEIAQLGVPGVTRVHFFIQKNGTVGNIEILWESDHPPMDFAARDAIADASPLPPLPAELGSEREGVTITFYYNTSPPGEGGRR